MAYVMKFKTLWGNDCEVRITPAGDDGRERTLTAAEEPFEIETDDDTAIDAVVRATTGTLRFIVEEGQEEVLDAILPSTLFGTKVETYLTNAETGERVCKFAGYIEITEYSQPWDSAPYEMELPVRDALSLMEDVRMEGEAVELCETANVAGVLYDAFKGVGLEPEGLHVESGTQEELGSVMQKEWLLEKTTEEKNGVATTYMHGMLWSDILERVLLPLGYTIWMEEGYVRLRRGSLPAQAFTLKWDEVKSIADGESVEAETRAIGFTQMRDALTNMSDGNTRGYLPGASRVLLKESLDDESVFEFDDDFVTWKLNSLQVNSSNTLWEWHGATTQRGVTMNRIFATSGSEAFEVPDSAGVCYRYSGAPVFGGVLCDLCGYATEEEPDQETLPHNPTTSVVFPVMDGRYLEKVDADAIKELGEKTMTMEIKGATLIDTRKEGALCIEGSLKMLDTVSSTEAYYPLEPPENKSVPTCLLIQLTMTNKETGIEYHYYGGSWLENPDESWYEMIYFDENGDTVMETKDKKLVLACRHDGGNYTTSSTASSGLKVSSRFRFDGIKGYTLLMKGLPRGTAEGLYEVSVKFYALVDYEISDEFSTIERAAHRLHYPDHYYLLSLSDVKITWHAVCVEGTLPDPGESTSGNYDAKYVEVADEHTYVCTHEGEDGEEEEVEFDTWGDGDGYKWGNTVQPDLLDREEWNAASKQYVGMRRTVEYADARLTEGEPSFYIDCGIPLIKTGGTWQAWNEGGRKKFVEIL